MTFIQYWGLVIKKYPAFKNDETKITIKISALKAFMQESHEKGEENKESPNFDFADLLNKFKK